MIKAGVAPALAEAVLAETRRVCGGESFYIRKRDSVKQASEVRALVARGLSFRAAARELGISDGSVRRVVSGG